MNAMRLLHWEVRGFLFLLAALLVYRMLTGQISLAGLLQDKLGAQTVSPARVQLLMATLALCFQYLVQVARGNGTTMPDINHQWLIVFGLSSGVYAFGKARGFWFLKR